MKRSTIIGLVIGTAAISLIGIYLWKKKNAPPADDAPPAEKPTSDTAAPKASSAPSSAPASKPAAKAAAKPSAAPKPPISGIAGVNVAKVLLNTDPKQLAGQKIYAAYDGMAVYNTVNKLYTKTKKGQLLGTFAYPQTSKTGGYDVYIKTRDTKNPYVWAKDSFLTF